MSFVGSSGSSSSKLTDNSTINFYLDLKSISNHSIYFKQSDNGLNKKCLYRIQKCTVVIRQLAYGTAVDIIDECIHIGETLQSNV